MGGKKDPRLEFLRRTAPGTPLREAIDRIVLLGRGGLILVADRSVASPIIAAGFELNAPFTPQAIVELSKMDRAVVVDEELKTILYANAHLVPSPSIPSQETGTRHRVAEQVAQQLGKLVIAVSEDSHQVTLFHGDWRYELQEIHTLLARVSQGLQILDRYRRELRELLSELAPLEFERRVFPSQVATVLQRALYMMELERDVEGTLVELGVHRELPERHLTALMRGVREEMELLVRDFKSDPRPAEEIMDDLLALPPEDVLRPDAVLRPLGITTEQDLEEPIPSRGYRLLSKVPRLPLSVIERLIEEIGTVDKVYRASRRQLDRVKGIAEARARAIEYGLSRFKNGYTATMDGF
ncbi:MAG TPA: DNA integrity scanning protein DisA [Candidatus Acetothermia bacterium]|nr:DNA integrity scanning protein DisA [Candidatus Acetothermia bacterium]HEU68976.1 DNA integrity scanning protein DisA [Candidatus Acetothermia bacterium]